GAHVLLGELDEVGADAVPHAARSRVQHHPDAVSLVEADLDEVVARAERAQLVQLRRLADLRVLVRDRVKLSAEARRPDLQRLLGRLTPAPAIAPSPTKAMRHGALDRATDLDERVRQL